MCFQLCLIHYSICINGTVSTDQANFIEAAYSESEAIKDVLLF